VLATHQAQLLEAARPGGALRWLGYLSSTGARSVRLSCL